MSARIIGLGETVMDILFKEIKDDKAATSEYVPFAAVPGGSTFNSMVSVGRSGVPCKFMGYTGNNKVGHQIVEFMHRNGISTEYFQIRNNERAALSLAYLDSNGDADYTFYKEEPLAATDYSMPEFTEKDYFLFGSYYSICPGLRPQVKDILENAHDAGTVIYYDINFRRSHSHQKQALLPVIQENCRLSSIVRGSADDFDILFGTRDPEEIYRKHISPFCPIFICTAGAGHIFIYTPTEAHDFIVPQIPAEEIVSTVGAGDSFNAGFLCAMYHRSIRKDQVLRLSYSQWEELISNGILYSSQVCRSQHNYINGNLRASEFCV